MHGAQVYELDCPGLVGMAVDLAMRGVEGGDRACQRLGGDRRPDRHLELEGLADIADFGGTNGRHLARRHPVGLHALEPDRMQALERLLDPFRHRLDDRHLEGGGIVVLDRGGEQPVGAERARRERHHRGGHAELLGDGEPVHRTGAAEQHQRESARIISALERH